jgi:uncharacterized protein (TIGR00369 family)
VTQKRDDSLRHWCYGCGAKNPEGLHIQFEVDGANVTGRFVTRQLQQGFPGVAHGGIAAAAMDEAMGWAMYAAGAWAMTMRLEVKYRRPLPLDEELTVTASVGRNRGRRLEATAEIRTLDGDLLAQANGIFLRLPEERTREFNDAFLGSA